MSPLPGHDALSSTLRPVTTTDEISLERNGAITSNAIITSATHTTATITSRPNFRVFGDRQHEAQYLGTHQRQVGYLPYNVPTSNASQGNQNNDIALAIQQLASSNEIASLPKSELLTFDSSSKNYNRFIASFKVNIKNKKSINDTNLTTIKDSIDDFDVNYAPRIEPASKEKLSGNMVSSSTEENSTIPDNYDSPDKSLQRIELDCIKLAMNT